MSADVSSDELWRRLAASQLPKLWVPSRENLHHIVEIPTLGTGKMDLKKLRDMAQSETRQRLPVADRVVAGVNL
jgi:acyl-[acyl-carrier-protein]-phospholipid O-acyltransferase/long-chain-fatty-acid--[acyl-carrier-protein] ligase